tara:strand:+ start:12 stop:1877 length:1866 start_codon:yes stop_codon:yes gene_type:complete
MSLTDVQTAHQDIKGSWSYDGKSVFFLRDDREGDERRLQVFQKNLESNLPATICDFALAEEDISPSDFYVSPHTPHFAYMASVGDEKYRVHVYNYSNQTKINEKRTHKGRQSFGGWTKSGFYFFEWADENGDSWKFHEFKFSKEVEDEEGDNVGYYPDLLGCIEETPIVFNRFAKFDNRIQWNNQSFTFLKESEKQGRLRDGTSNGKGGLLCIREWNQSDASEIVEFSLNNEGEMVEDIVVSSEEIKRFVNNSKNTDNLRGEIEGFFLSGKEIIIHINQDGVSQLYRYLLEDNTNSQINLGDIEEKIGAFWIEHISHDENHGILLTVSSFSASQHIWMLPPSDTETKRITEPAMTLELSVIESNEYTPTGMQYFEIIPKTSTNNMDTIIFFHGGPTVQTTNKWDRVISSFLSEGYRVIAPNPQGSIGRGARYAGLDDGEKRHTLIDNEVGPFVKQISNNSKSSNLFMYGGSYGGWLVLSLATSPWGEFVQAGASRNGIGDMITFFNKTSRWRREHRAREYLGSTEGKTETEIRDLMKKISPFEKGCDDLTCTRLKLFVGTKDSRVPSDSSQIFVNKMNKSYPDVEMHPPFEYEGHKIKRLSNRIETMEKSCQLFKNSKSQS